MKISNRYSLLLNERLRTSRPSAVVHWFFCRLSSLAQAGSIPSVAQIGFTSPRGTREWGALELRSWSHSQLLVVCCFTQLLEIAKLVQATTFRGIPDPTIQLNSLTTSLGQVGTQCRLQGFKGKVTEGGRGVVTHTLPFLFNLRQVRTGPHFSSHTLTRD